MKIKPIGKEIYTVNNINICVLGGDDRMVYALGELSKAYKIGCFGIDRDEAFAFKYTDLKTAVCNSNVILLPLPFSTDRIRVFSPLCSLDIKLDSLLSHLNENHKVIGGKMSDDFIQKLTEKGCKYYDYYNSEQLTIMNAIPTAEGALSIAINETDITLFGSKCAIFGYGRIGRILARYLKNMGANVTVFARSEQALSWAEAEGCTPVYFSDAQSKIAEKDVIFNTVPALIIDKKLIDKTKKDVLIIDLASAPGGVDRDYAKKKSRKVIFALSLPGKIAPKSAGCAIANCVSSRLRGGIL